MRSFAPTLGNLLFALLIASSALLFAAETKKVAILEIEDTENVLDHGQKLMLRSSLAKAVATPPASPSCSDLPRPSACPPFPPRPDHRLDYLGLSPDRRSPAS